MPCRGFLCPKNGMKQISFNDCATSCTKRCMSRRTTRLFEKYNKDRGLNEFSITQLISPTRYQWLSTVFDYYEPKEDMIARTIGSLGHTIAETKDGQIRSEERLKMEIKPGVFVSGAFDSYEGGDLWDLKICGYFKIKKGLEDVRNLHDWTIQLNFYRMLITEAPVHNMYIETWAREPRSVCARGKTPQHHVFKIPLLSDWLVLKYVRVKYDRLMEVLKGDREPQCKPRELWDGRRCKYCAVRKECEAVEEAHRE